LEHSLRRGINVAKESLYIGKRIPNNIDKIKRSFLSEVYRIQFFGSLEKIKEKYSAERRKTTRSAREKTIAEFATRFTYDSQRIEGSTLTLLETAILLEKGISPKNRPIADVKEAEAHKDLFYEMLAHKKDLNFSIILQWHTLLFQYTKRDIAGKIRKHRVRISGSNFIPPLPVEIYPMIQEFFKWYNREKEKLNTVHLASLVHLKFVTIHPFSDGNGRISRLLMNFILNRGGYPMLNIPYQGRNGYYKALERSQIRKEEDFFLQWFMRNYIKMHKSYLG
jgi:Fic family protein